MNNQEQWHISVLHTSNFDDPRPVPLTFANPKLLETFFSSFPGTDIYVNKPERWHITIFHTSKFDDPRPAPLESGDPGLLETAPGQRPLPTSQQLQQEQQKLQEIVSHIQPVNLKVLNRY